MRLGSSSALPILIASLALSVSALRLGSSSTHAIDARGPVSLDEAEVMARAFVDAELDARELMEAQWLEARGGRIIYTEGKPSPRKFYKSHNY
ncbi:hypothetical protein DAEQUDRAFT_808163 [Daedalea quercina L-15889]|uniref:Uncharacterized protein n=1 Tax=Daedalea quercina L-15889 TaxID=1314783 RepID=A0A165TI85_9APHY|nr:hypothetical protein DAEQUDRAFT_808163 [Daedalea quercina L-15889]